MEWLIQYVCKTADVQPVSANVPAGVEILRRVSEKSTFLFVLNHSGETMNVPIEEYARDLLTDMEINGSLELEPSGVAILQIRP
jgi:beta-galactosidase